VKLPTLTTTVVSSIGDRSKGTSVSARNAQYQSPASTTGILPSRAGSCGCPENWWCLGPCILGSCAGQCVPW
jgi:hypothetical protein